MSASTRSPRPNSPGVGPTSTRTRSACYLGLRRVPVVARRGRNRSIQRPTRGALQHEPELCGALAGHSQGARSPVHRRSRPAEHRAEPARCDFHRTWGFPDQRATSPLPNTATALGSSRAQRPWLVVIGHEAPTLERAREQHAGSLVAGHKRESASSRADDEPAGHRDQRIEAAISAAASRAREPSSAKRDSGTRSRGPQTLTMAKGRWLASKTGAATPYTCDSSSPTLTL